MSWVASVRRVAAFEPGGADDRDRLVASAEIVASAGYTSGRELIAHVGVGARAEVDLVLSPPGRPDLVFNSVPVDRHLRLPAGC